MKLQKSYVVALIVFLLAGVSWGEALGFQVTKGNDGNSGCGCGAKPAAPTNPTTDAATP